LIALSDVRIGWQLVRALPGFLRAPVHAEEARGILALRLEHRERDFLAVLKASVFDNPSSAYLPLLRHGGCEYGDLADLVKREGLEGVLTRLFHAGVYLTVEEFKGRHPVVRGGLEIPLEPSGTLNPRTRALVPTRSSGSRGTRRGVLFDLEYIRDCAVDRCLAYDAWGGRDWVKAVWLVPGGSGMVDLLEHTLESRPARWFSHLDPAAPGLDARYRWGPRVLRWASFLAWPPLPAPRHVPVDEPRPIVEWMADVRRNGRTPHLYTFASSAVRVSQAALDRGVDLRGVTFTLIGEPVTAARLAVIHRAGARAIVDYGASETGSFAYGCMAPEGPDDVHFCHDLLAAIQPGAGGPATRLARDALLFSTLRPKAPVVLLNVSLGDRARVEDRDCGCPLGDLGWPTHMRQVGSFEKLTAGGMTFLDADVVRILEDVLPRAFGGIATDYQLVEAEDARGQPDVRLVIHPRIGPIDPTAVLEVFLAALGAGPGPERVMGSLWRDARLVRVERRPPYTTQSGKILHLHHGRSTSTADTSGPPALGIRPGSPTA
jgi:hypothetical protein